MVGQVDDHRLTRIQGGEQFDTGHWLRLNG
jgi:hypothetical protein